MEWMAPKITIAYRRFLNTHSRYVIVQHVFFTVYYYCRMLNDKEKELLKEILILLSEKDLQLLAQTVTDNMIVPLTTEGKLMFENIFK
jgi:hypothetical protein